MIGLKISRHFHNQSELKPKPIATRSRTFSRASCRLLEFAFGFDWFTGLPSPFVIGQSDYFGLVLRHLIENCSIRGGGMSVSSRLEIYDIIK